MKTFEDLGLKDELLSAITKMGFITPTPIQSKTIPNLLSSVRNIIALAQTGTGKTAAFGLPAIQLTDIADRRTQTIILAPTRELCLQIAKDLENYAVNIKGLNITAVYGGANIMTQISALKRGAQIVVGTPGRTKDLIKRRKLLLGNVQRVILDEADEMLTMGFKEDLDDILAETPQEKQTLLFSATMSKEISTITRKYMNDAIEIEAESRNTATKNIEHLYYSVQAKDKYEVLKRIADMNPTIYGIVFCRTRRETQEISAKLMKDGYNADAIHGDLSQVQRDEVMGRFRTRHLQILVATDVAARGLDVTDLTHIINYSLPDDSEVYVHRSGRTGRAGKTGISIALIHSREGRKISEIENKYKISFSRERVPSGNDICQKQLYALIEKIEKVEVDTQQIDPFMPAIYEKLEHLNREDLIKHFVSAEFNRFLTYYKYSQDLNVSDRGKKRDKREERGDRGERGERASRGERDTNYTRLFINVGLANNLNPARLIGLINEALGSNDTAIGKIEVMKTFAFFDIEKNVESELIQSLKGKEFEGVSINVEVSKEKPVSHSRDRGFKERSFGGNKGGFKGGFKGGSSKRRTGKSDGKSFGGNRSKYRSKNEA
jgi:ATP-dependent RNA helicase DeaD